MNKWLKLSVFSAIGIIISMILLSFISPSSNYGYRTNMNAGVRMNNQAMQGMQANSGMNMGDNSQGGMSMMNMGNNSQGGMGMMNMGSSPQSGMGMMNMGGSGMMSMGNMQQGGMSSMPVSNMSSMPSTISVQGSANIQMMQMINQLQMQINQLSQQINSMSNMSAGGSASGSGSMSGGGGGGMSMM